MPYDLDVEYERHMKGGVGDASVSEASGPVTEALVRGFGYLRSIQSAHGGWTGDYDGPLFLLPGYIFLHRIVGRLLSETKARHDRQPLAAFDPIALALLLLHAAVSIEQRGQQALGGE